MSEPRSYDEVHAEQVANVAQAVAQAQAADSAQVAQATAWVAGGLPADTSAVTPGPHQHD